MALAERYVTGGAMQVIALKEIIDGVNAMDLDPATRQQFQKLVRSVGIAHGLAWLEREDRITFARALLAKGVSRATVKDRLMANFDVSRPHAYRIIVASLQLSQESPSNETRPVSNTPITQK